MTANQFRKAALGLPEAEEGAHMGHADFRVGGKIFASLGYPDEDHGAVMLSPEEQRYFLVGHGDAFAPAPGAWGARGNTIVRLKRADAAAVRAALEGAWRRRAPKRLVKG